MINKSNITGIILAGGQSSRMGADKGFVTYKGKPFVLHSIDALKPFVDTILIVSDHKDYDTLKKCQRVEDVFSKAGPLSGLYSGLKASKTKLNLVLSCDVPLVTSQIVEKLILSINKNDDAVVCKVKEKRMPLVAVYNKACEATCFQLLKNDERRMMQLLKQLNQVQYLELNDVEALQVKNINSPTELKAIENEN